MGIPNTLNGEKNRIEVCFHHTINANHIQNIVLQLNEKLFINYEILFYLSATACFELLLNTQNVAQ